MGTVKHSMGGNATGNMVMLTTTTTDTAPLPVPPDAPKCALKQAWLRIPGYYISTLAREELWPPSSVKMFRPKHRTQAWLKHYNAFVQAREGSGLSLKPYAFQGGSGYRTQKAQGVMTLHNGTAYALVAQRPAIKGIVQDFNDTLLRGQWLMDEETFPCFARPCPVSPRHGFVDSVIIKDVGQLFDILTRAKKEDKEAELVLMPVLTSRYSGVITTSGLSIGLGNDGVTSGKGRSVFIPASTDLFKRLSRLRMSGEDMAKTLSWVDGGSPYIEFVENDFQPVLVQIRPGPCPQGGGTDWVPDNIPKVRRVLVCDQDIPVGRSMPLLEWEKYLAEATAKGKKGLVAWLPGHTLASHYAVQAIIHNIPVVTGRIRPVRGEKLAMTVAAPALESEDYHQIASSLASRALFPLVHPSDPVAWARDVTLLTMGVAHAHMTWGGSKHLNALRGQGAALAIRLGLVVCLGEARHWETHCHNRSQNIPSINERLRDFAAHKNATIPGALDLKTKLKDRVLPRNIIFDWALSAPLDELLEWGAISIRAFQDGYWAGSYGGYPWSQVGHLSLNLQAAAVQFCKSPCEATWVQVCRCFDFTVDAVHNGGRALSKFISDEALKIVADEPVWGMTSSLVVEICLGSLRVDLWGGQATPNAVQVFRTMEVPDHVEKAQEEFQAWEDEGEGGDPDDAEFPDDPPED